MKAHARILVLLLALAMLLSACGSQEPSGGEPEVKDTLIVGNSAEPTVLDPPNQQNTPAGLINVQVYDGLLRQNNETGEIEPCLAESWFQAEMHHRLASIDAFRPHISLSGI